MTTTTTNTPIGCGTCVNDPHLPPPPHHHHSHMSLSAGLNQPSELNTVSLCPPIPMDFRNCQSNGPGAPLSLALPSVAQNNNNNCTITTPISTNESLRDNPCHLIYSSTQNYSSYHGSTDPVGGYPRESMLSNQEQAQQQQQLSVNVDNIVNSGQPSSICADFQIKQESDVILSPARTRSLSVHSLPGSLAQPFHIIGQSADRLFVEKREEDCRIGGGGGGGGVYRPYPISTTPLPVCYAASGPLAGVMLHSPHLPMVSDPTMSNASHLTTHSNTLSPQSLTSQGQSQHPPPIVHHFPVDLNSSSNTISLSQQQRLQSIDRSPFASPNDTHLQLQNFAFMSANPALDEASSQNNIKRANGNGLCGTSVACDLSGPPNLSLELSPRSKARRYSYPHEPLGGDLKPSYTIHPVDRSNYHAQSPSLCRNVVSAAATSGATTGLPTILLNGSRAMSTPISSVSTDDLVNATGRGASHTLSNHHLIDQNSLTLEGDVPLPGFSSPESAFYQYQNRMEGQRCQVCGELAAGFHHGAYVCEACKKFFMRHSLSDTKPTNVCPTGGSCIVAKGSRGKCQICRYRKCLYVGMKMKDPESQPDIDISNIPCRVCGGRSSGFHFGALTCEGCKGFFRRTEGSSGSLVCVGGQNACTITPRSRNACKSCRFRRCIAAGMSKKGSRIGRQPNAVKFHCAIEIRQLRSFRGGYNNDSIDGQMGQTGSSSHPYGGPFNLDMGPMMVDAQGPSSVYNRSDVESPRNSPETLTPTYSTKRDPGIWLNEQKPPLSLLLLLPRTSDPIDTMSPMTAVHPGSHMHRYSPASDRSAQCNKENALEVANMNHPMTISPSMGLNSLPHSAIRLPMDGANELTHPDPRSASDDDEVELSSTEHDDGPYHHHHHLPNRQSAMHMTSINNNNHPNHRVPVSLIVQSLLASSGRQTDGDTSTPHSARVTNECGGGGGSGHNFAKNGARSANHMLDSNLNANQTTALIASLAERVAAEDDGVDDEEDVEWNGFISDDEGSGGKRMREPVDMSEMDDVSARAQTPSQDAILRFTDGMRTATEFLRLPNTYFKTRFRMTSISMEHQDNSVHVWSHMMNHFHMHAQQIVQFAKLVPGFNHLGITARSNLVRGAMFPVVLLLLSRDYCPETDDYNYFDFTKEERDIIMRHFPTFLRITEHLRMTGRLLFHLDLSLPELSLCSAVEILRDYQMLEEPARSNTRDLFVLAHHSLRTCMSKRLDNLIDAEDGQRWTQLVALSKMIQAMNREHHDIVSTLKDIRTDLNFPELYIEMFQLADGASALLSASAKAVTLACSSAFHSIAPLKLALSRPGSPDASSGASNSVSASGLEGGGGATGFGPPNGSMMPEEQLPSSLFLPTAAVNSGGSGGGGGDRWDAGRLALSVPAAMAAMAAAAASQQQHPPQQQQSKQESSSNNNTPVSTSYFSAPPSFFFPSQQPPPPTS